MNATPGTDWQARRLAWARAEAEERGEPSAWRYLGDLAAALGDFPLALGAHRRAAGKAAVAAPPDALRVAPADANLDRRLAVALAAAEAATAALPEPSPSVPDKPARKRGRPRKPPKPAAPAVAAPPAAAHAVSPPAALATPVAAPPSAGAWPIRLKAAAPRARRAWLEKMLAGGGGRLTERPDGLWCELPESAARLVPHLRRHPELEE